VTTTTVRLDPDEERTLDELAEIQGAARTRSASVFACSPRRRNGTLLWPICSQRGNARPVRSTTRARDDERPLRCGRAGRRCRREVNTMPRSGCHARTCLITWSG